MHWFVCKGYWGFIFTNVLFFLLLQLVTAITTKVPIIKRLKGYVFFEHNSLHVAISI
jgi:hypothetical protein